MTRIQVNDIRLNVEAWGEGAPLLLLHGFTGCAANWQPFAGRWPDYRTIAVDIIGHGGSDRPEDPTRYTMEQAADDIAAVLDRLDVARTALLGYSMGGRLALHFAVRHSDRLSALVLESASPGIAAAAEREARVRSDEELANRIEQDGLEWFVDYWQALPLWESQSSLPEQRRAALRRQRLSTNSVRGLANSLRGMGAGAQTPLWDRLSELRLPALFLAGEYDAKYVDAARRMETLVPGSEVEIISAAGHATHFEQPEALAHVVRTFLNELHDEERATSTNERRHRT